MSIGYIPKKLKHERRQRRLKKKYSCKTCGQKEICMKAYYSDYTIKFCPKWSPSYIEKETSHSKKTAKKRKRKFFR